MSLKLTRRIRHLKKAPSRGGSAVLRAAPQGIDREAGVIRGFSVISQGEALGHDMWIDAEFLEEVVAAIPEEPGMKARFTHPGLSSDGLGTALGRVGNARLEGGRVLADLHLLETASDAPDGDLAQYVLDLAEEAPEFFGASIVFKPDRRAQELFALQHSDEDGDFSSPDPANTKNLEHARLAALRAVDVVDSPAANPEGMFAALSEEGELVEEFEGLLGYVLGLDREAPAGVEWLPVHPDRLKGFTAKFLAGRELALQTLTTTTENMSTTTKPTFGGLFKRAPKTDDLSALRVEVGRLESELDQSEAAREEESRSASEEIAELTARVVLLEEQLSGSRERAEELGEELQTERAGAREVEELAAEKTNAVLARLGADEALQIAEDSEAEPSASMLDTYNAMEGGPDKLAFLNQNKETLRREAERADLRARIKGL